MQRWHPKLLESSVEVPILLNLYLALLKDGVGDIHLLIVTKELMLAG